MKDKEHIIDGRKYLVKVSPEDDQPGAFVIIGPPEGLVDDMGLSEPFATNLHNVLYARHLFTYQEVARPNAALGALQEAKAMGGMISDAKEYIHPLVEAFAAFILEAPVE